MCKGDASDVRAALEAIWAQDPGDGGLLEDGEELPPLAMARGEEKKEGERRVQRSGKQGTGAPVVKQSVLKLVYHWWPWVLEGKYWH